MQSTQGLYERCLKDLEILEVCLLTNRTIDNCSQRSTIKLCQQIKHQFVTSKRHLEKSLKECKVLKRENERMQGLVEQYDLKESMSSRMGFM